MKRFIISTICVIAALTVLRAQDSSDNFWEVSKFYHASTDLDARVNYSVKDFNGKLCAIIKIETPYSAFSFSTGTLEVIKAEKKVGEWWVYVQEGVKKITIGHENGILRDWRFPEAIKSGNVYVMRLKAARAIASASGSGAKTQNISMSSGRIGKYTVTVDDLPASKIAEKRIYNVGGVEFTMIRIKGEEFFISETEVTQDLWYAVMGTKPSKYRGAANPVECVSWIDCQKFVRKLSRLAKEKFALPTETQWETASRGGDFKNAAYVARKEDIRSFDVNSAQSDEYGLRGMLCNVGEWCRDGGNGKEKIYRGISVGFYPSASEKRDKLSKNARVPYVGLRLVIN